MAMMHRRRLLKRLNVDRVRRAIEEAEKKTSGEIRVSVARFFWGKARPVAERAFRRLGMSNTRERNAVLFFIVPSRKQFIVLGDEGIHAMVGQDFWDRTSAVVAEHFRKGEFTEGLVKGIETAGEALAIHFPYDATTDVNELPDEIDFGKD